MKTAGIVVEYNPMHHGHLFHLRKTREITGADVVIAVMSGNVVQRGEFAIADKFTRTQWALDAGIDLVLELPAFHTLQSADRFAWAAIKILDLLKTDALVFGSESGDLLKLKAQSEIMRTDAYNDKVKALMQEGHSYPSANQAVLETMSGNTMTQTPNDILGVQYLDAIHTVGSSIRPYAIKRLESGYYASYDKDRTIQSATAIRKRILNGESIEKSVPDHVHRSLKSCPLNTLFHYDTVIRYLLSIHSSASLSDIFSFEEGLENWMLRHRDKQSHEELVQAMSTKRYTHARIKRSIMHMMLNTTKKNAPEFTIPYLRVLGMNATGQKHLNTIKGDLPVPLITKISRSRDRLLDFELKTTRVYAAETDKTLYLREFEPVIIL
ncbi:MAG: nucleotidyltransferase [Candidatus Izemoplasmataceae bacterium]